MTLLYIHGFNSAPDDSSPKIKAFEKLGHTIVQLAYQTTDGRDITIENLRKSTERIFGLHDRLDCVFIGTSLGGYYASILAEIFSRPGILLNPLIDPAPHLKAIVGKTLTNYVTGENHSLTKRSHESFVGHAINADPAQYTTRPLVLLAKDDDVLDYNIANTKLAKFHIVLTESGGHTYHDASSVIKPITSYLASCEYKTTRTLQD